VPLETAALNAGADGVSGVIGKVSLHTSNPGGTGANEVSGGGYTRQNITWAAASGGVASKSGGDIAFVGPASQAITHVGFWTAGNAWRGSVVPTGDLAFNAAGQLSLTAATITATG